ncbi:ATP-binding cassette domain-containing protein [Escherichia coli]|uniref:ATP-binding cassette domain-containing protein n=1 Tax=Escherichia coli TaxID=562 RepID=UPI00396D8373
MTPLLELKDIRRSYPAGDEQVEVLKGISLDIYAGEMVAIVGASGSGKSTLMNILGCLDKATSGTYRVAGQDVATLDADALAQLRREHFGFIFQRYHLLSHLTAEQNVEVPAVYAGLERKQRLLRAQELLQRLGLEDRTEYYPAQLSGGQQQRVSIARALMNGGQVILADEPTGALDSHSGEEVMAILHQLRDRGHTVIIVTHDPQVAAQAERVIEIRDGEIVRNPPAVEKVNATGGTEPVVNTASGWRQFVSGFNEALTMAWRALAANKMRTLLTMLAGKANTVSASMKALEDARERALVVGFSLIIMPDMTRYAGDGAGIKAITGGDKVAIDPKHKAPYSTRIPAVVLAVNNNAMSFSDRSGGISRRRVIFNFSEVVPENERDSMLAEKIEGELAVVIRHLLTRFADQDEARRLLYEQQKSEEALAIKREGDSLVDFCGYLMASVMCDGLLVGNAEIVPFSPRRYLYHAYLAYMKAHGFGKPVTLTRFGKDMPGAMAEYGREYMKRKTKHGLRSNVTLTEESEDWMPSCVSVTNDDSKN